MSLSFKEFKQNCVNGSLVLLKKIAKVMPLAVIRWFINGLYLIAYLGIHKNRAICVSNLKEVYGSSKTLQAYRSMTNMIIKNVALTMLDLLHYVERPEDFIKRFTIQNEERLKEALSRGKGVLAVTGHLGNFPLMFVGLVQRGYKVNVVIRPMRDSNFSDFMYELCAKWGINMIQTNPKQKFLKETLRVLRKGELLFFLLDEVVEEEGSVQVKFFGKEVSRATGPMLYQKRLGSPIVPIFITKDDKGFFQVFVENEVPVNDKGDREIENQQSIASITQIIEEYVKNYPLQWGGWLNKRWGGE